MFVSTVTDVERRSALHVWTDPTEQMLSWTANGRSHARGHYILCLYRIRSLLMITRALHWKILFFIPYFLNIIFDFIHLSTLKLSRESVVETANRPRAGRLGVRIPAEEEIFLSFKTSRSALHGTTTLLFSGYRRSFPGVKRSEPEVDHSPLSLLKLRIGGAITLLILSAWWTWILRSGFRSGLKCEKWYNVIMLTWRTAWSGTNLHLHCCIATD
jgi:hypothetical protein